MVSYQSGFSDFIEKYVFYQESSGSWSEVRARNLRYFDSFCAECFPGRALCQEMVDAWCGKRDTESKSSCITRTGVIRSFIKYLRKRGMTDVLPVPVPKAEKRTRVPHAFTKEELQKYFHECDSIVPYKPSPKFLLLKMTCPVFFRLLYSSGIRTTEARKLKRSEVDLAHGVLDIRETKGYAQHYVALHASMTDLLRQYDQEVEIIYPGRTYFFENAMGNGYSRQWVVYIFRKLWEKANGKDNRPVAYGLRHHYAVENINRWEEDAFGFSEKLLSLSKSMGHSEINATLYYYSIVPGMSDILRENLNTYAPTFLTNSRHTLKSYKDSLVLYLSFLEAEDIEPDCFSQKCFERAWIEKWMLWLKETRRCSSGTCNVRLGSLRVFLEYLGEKDIEYLYLYQEAKKIKRQKCTKKKVCGLTRNAIAAMLSAPDLSTRTGKRDAVFLTVLYATAGRLDEIRSIKISHIHLDDPKPYLILL